MRILMTTYSCKAVEVVREFKGIPVMDDPFWKCLISPGYVKDIRNEHIK